MAVYRFRITFEDHDDVIREIDILSTHTFEDLHNAIQLAIQFDNTKNASFFVSDDFWRKGIEITMTKNSEYFFKRKENDAIHLMSKTKVAAFIDDPHQKFLYYFDPKSPWGFYVELVKILDADSRISYPKCTKQTGEAPKQYKQVIAPVPDEEIEDFDPEEQEKEKIFSGEEDYDKEEENQDEDFLTEGEDESSEENEFEENEGHSESEEEH